MRIRRACYDKPRRCPGWAGGGFRYAKTTVCDNGKIPYTGSRWDGWLIKTCATCGTVRLPIVLKWLDPEWLAFSLHQKVKYWRD